MKEIPSKLVSKIGFWAAVLTLFGIAYIIALFATLAGLLKPPWDMTYQVLPSLFLAPAFLVLIIANNYVPEERKIWSNIRLAFAIMYATIASIMYFTLLSVTLPNMLQGTAFKLGSTGMGIRRFFTEC